MAANEIVRYQSLQDLQTVAQTFALTGYFDAKGATPVEVAKALTKILAGQEMGFGPYASMKGIYIIQGQTTVSGNLIASAIKKSPKYDYRVREKSDKVCRIEFYENAGGKWESLGIEVFTDADAKRAGTKNMDRFPANMLFNRCISNGYRTHCPDVFESGPVYVPEEMGAVQNEEGDYIESTARTVDQDTGEIVEPSSSPGAFLSKAQAVIGNPPFAAAQEPWQAWEKPADAYRWAVDEGHAAGLDDARGAFAVIVGELGGKLTGGNRDTAFRRFYQTVFETQPDPADDADEPAQAPLVDVPEKSAVYN